VSRTGSIVFATKSGLGILAKNLYESKIIDKVFIAGHPKFESHPEWYDRKDVVLSEKELIDSVDTLFILEAPLPDPFDWSIVELAQSMGKRVVLMPMYESTPRSHLVFMDKIICPSLLDLEYYEDYDSCFIPVPSPTDVEWKLRERANVFVHNVGHGGIYSRNGTAEIIKALPLIKSQDIKIIIRVQPDANPDIAQLLDSISDHRVSIEKRHVPFKELWSTGDVFLFPEKFNGLSLPLQEAHAAGMLVMAGDRSPVNTWLPKEPLIPVSGYFNTELPWIGIKVRNAIMSPEDIAKTIDQWAGKDISEYSKIGQSWASQNTGDLLREKYLEQLHVKK
jgi:hypothetical protein|tara:strand:+ start:636 stop:1643 length:1008 start_codon:yes stop_codon:yes gene_type:complete